MIQLQVSTHDHEEMLAITPAVRKAIRENGGSDCAPYNRGRDRQEDKCLLPEITLVKSVQLSLLIHG